MRLWFSLSRNPVGLRNEADDDTIATNDSQQLAASYAMYGRMVLTLAILVPGSAHVSTFTRQSRDELVKIFTSEFVEITPGSGKFPKPAKALQQFSICKFETTQSLYAAVMGSNPSRWKGARNSVESMSYVEVEAFCRRVTILMRGAKLIKGDEHIRLPTEAEWEYCCRAGTKTDYSFGKSATQAGDAEPKATRLDAYAWHHGNAAGNDPAVGILKPNPWGLYDMHGYLWEYCSDAWRPSPEAPAAKELPGSTQRVMRGGSWRDHYSMCKSSTRWAVPDHVKSDAIGFRCVRSKVEKTD